MQFKLRDKLENVHQITQESGGNSISCKSHSICAVLNVELRGSGLYSTRKPIILPTNDAPREIMDDTLSFQYDTIYVIRFYS